METLIQGGGSYTPSTTATQYQPLQGSCTPWYATVGDCYQVMPCAGTLSRLYVFSRSASGTGKSRLISVYKNGIATTLAVTLEGGSDYYGEDNGSISVAAGDLVAIEHAPTGTPSAYPIMWCLVFTATTSGQSVVLGNAAIGAQGNLNATTTEYAHCQTGGAYLGLGGVDPIAIGQPMPTAGKFSAFYVNLDGAPDTGGSDGYVFTLQVNGVDQALAVTITGDDTTGNASTDIALAAGDKVRIKIAPSGTPVGTPHAQWGFRWEPTTSGESIVLGESSNSPATNNTEYIPPNVGGHAVPPWSGSTSYDNTQPVWSMIASKFYILLKTAPGSGASRTFTIWEKIGHTTVGAESDTALTITIEDTAVSGNDTTNEVAVRDYDHLAIKTVPSSNPDAPTSIAWGYVQKLSRSYPELPEGDLTRVTGIRHVYRPGFSRMLVSLGDVSNTIEIAEAKAREELEIPERQTPKEPKPPKAVEPTAMKMAPPVEPPEILGASAKVTAPEPIINWERIPKVEPEPEPPPTANRCPYPECAGRTFATETELLVHLRQVHGGM